MFLRIIVQLVFVANILIGSEECHNNQSVEIAMGTENEYKETSIMMNTWTDVEVQCKASQPIESCEWTKKRIGISRQIETWQNMPYSVEIKNNTCSLKIPELEYNDTIGNDVQLRCTLNAAEKETVGHLTFWSRCDARDEKERILYIPENMNSSFKHILWESNSVEKLQICVKGEKVCGQYWSEETHQFERYDSVTIYSPCPVLDIMTDMI